MENEVVYINLDDIIPNRFQPREVFDEKALNELSESIRQHGVIEPIIVRPVSNKFEIVAGERRYKASALAGLTKIPALVRNMDDKESSLVAFIENEQRKDVSVIESAKTCERILKANNMTQEELAKSIGISQSTLANRIRLLDLPLEVQEALMHNEISERHARSLLTVKDTNKQIELLNKIKEKRMTVRDLESEIKSMNNNFNNNINLENNVPPMNNINSGNNNDFMQYLNDYDNTNPIPATENNYTQPQNVIPNNEYKSDSNFMNFLNNYDNVPTQAPVPNEASQEIPTEKENDYMNYLNNYSNTPAPAPVSNEVNQEIPTGAENNYMNFLNNYNNVPTQAPVSNEASQGIPTEKENDYMNYLNNYDNAQEQNNFFTDSSNNIEHIEDINDNYNNNSNLMINSVNPPITSNFNNYDVNGYVEDNPNYVDISKGVTLDSVDDVINELKNTIDGIKVKSKFKVDTEEIDYDDLYQVTIKIDKRDF